MTKEVSTNLKEELANDTKNKLSHLKKMIGDLKKKVNRYYDETEVIRASYQTHGALTRQVQEKVSLKMIDKQLTLNKIASIF